MQITLNIDKTRIASKDEAKTKAGIITNNCRNSAAVKTVSPEELIQAVEQGRTFTPAKLNGSTADTWESQQIICADIDNEEETEEDGKKIKRRLARTLTPPLAIEIMKSYNIESYFMYYTFSSKPEHQKFRIVLILDTPITEAEEAADLGRRFTAIFNKAVEHCADTAVNENARMLFGGKKDCAFNITREITPLETLRALPKVEEEKPKPSEVIQKDCTPRNQTPRTFTDYEAEDRQFNYDKEHFDLVEYISATTNCDIKLTGEYYTVNPCPICGHGDDFKIHRNRKHLFNCFSVNGDKGGTIIDYLINAEAEEPKDTAQAINYFKYNIMNYARPERKQTEATPSKPSEVTEPTESPQTMTAHSVTDYLKTDIFKSDIEYFKQYKDRKTGFEDIDKYFTIYPGLAALGGASSLGKTTFIVNLIDNLLSRGETVLFFSLEQLPIEIVTKSLTKSLYNHNPISELTNIDIKNGATCSDLQKIKKQYQELAEGKYQIITGSFRTTAKDIVNYVETFRADNGGENCKPIVIIDYLQLIAPPEGFKGDTRAATDENIKTLKDFQKRNELFVIFVSSFNRDSNLKPISYEAFKETSMIEYTCDYVWGLQLQIQDAENEDFYFATGSRGGKRETKEHEKRKMIYEAQRIKPKKVQFVSLKNRNGKQFYKANFEYYPQYDCFVKDNKPVKPTSKDLKPFPPFGGSSDDFEIIE